MNRAISTIHKLDKNLSVSQFSKFKNPKKRHAPTNLVNGAGIHCKIPASWRKRLQTKADKHTEGNLSEYLRQIIFEDLKYKKGELYAST